MLNLIKKLYYDSRIRYLFFGGLTTLVNIVVFGILEGPLEIDYKISNFFSVAIAICFAFVVNKLYVFQSKSKTFGDTVQEFITFCVELLGQPKMVAKIETQVIVVIVNYFISKLFVFKSGSEQNK